MKLKPSRKIDTPEVTSLRVELLRRDLSRQDLAQQCGLSVGTINNNLSLGFPNPLARLRVESVLGAPIFSTPEQFETRQHVIAAAGFDPWLSTFVQLAKAVRKYRFRGRAKLRTRTALIEALAARFSTVKPTRTKNPYEH